MAAAPRPPKFPTGLRVKPATGNVDDSFGPASVKQSLADMDAAGVGYQAPRLDPATVPETPDFASVRAAATTGATPGYQLPAQPDYGQMKELLDKANRLGMLHGIFGVHTPSTYEVMRTGSAAATVPPSPAYDAARASILAPLQLEQARLKSTNDARTLLNQYLATTGAARNGNTDMAARFAQEHSQSVAAGKAAQAAQANVDTANDRAEAQFGVTSGQHAQQLAETARHNKAMEDAAANKPNAAAQKFSLAEEQSINKAQEIVDRAQQTNALIQKYGNLGPLLQYGTIPAAVGRATGLSAGVKDATGRTVPPAELADDANELKSHTEYLTNEAPRALAASGRMDRQSMKEMKDSFPTATDSAESAQRKLSQYTRHGASLIRKINAAHNDAAREKFYGGGPLPGEEELNAYQARAEQAAGAPGAAPAGARSLRQTLGADQYIQYLHDAFGTLNDPNASAADKAEASTFMRRASAEDAAQKGTR